MLRNGLPWLWPGPVLLRFSIVLWRTRIFRFTVLWFSLLWFALRRLSVRWFALRWFALRRLALLWFALRRPACVLLSVVLLWSAGGLRTGLLARMWLSEELLWDFPRPQLLLQLLRRLQPGLHARLWTHVQPGLWACVRSLLWLDLRSASLWRLRAGVRSGGPAEPLRHSRRLCAADFRAAVAVAHVQQQGRHANDYRTGRAISRGAAHADQETIRPAVRG
jgi:hypothetical protein